MTKSDKLIDLVAKLGRLRIETRFLTTENARLRAEIARLQDPEEVLVSMTVFREPRFDATAGEQPGPARLTDGGEFQIDLDEVRCLLIDRCAPSWTGWESISVGATVVKGAIELKLEDV